MVQRERSWYYVRTLEHSWAQLLIGWLQFVSVNTRNISALLFHVYLQKSASTWYWIFCMFPFTFKQNSYTETNIYSYKLYSNYVIVLLFTRYSYDKTRFMKLMSERFKASSCEWGVSMTCILLKNLNLNFYRAMQTIIIMLLVLQQ